MNADRIKQIEYSSLIIGSKTIPPALIATNRRVNSQGQSKNFMRKTEVQSAKNGKTRRNHVRSKNERPDIFLEGEHVSNQPLIIFKGEIDSRFIESCKEKFRKNIITKKY